MNSGAKAIAAFALVVSLAAPAFGSDWSAPVRLSPPTQSAWFPDIAVDRSGQAHVFWHSQVQFGGRLRDAVVYCRPGEAGCDATAPVLVSMVDDMGSYVTRPTVAIDGDDRAQVVWRSKMKLFFSTAPVARIADPMAWQTRHVFSSNSSYSAIAVDASGTLHAAWSEGTDVATGGPCPGCADIDYAQSRDGGDNWTPPRALAATAQGSEKPQIAFGRDSTVFVGWEEGLDFYRGKGAPTSSMLVASADDGKSWEAPVEFRIEGDSPQVIAIGVDAAGNVVAVWQQSKGNRIDSQSSSDRGRTWSAPLAIEGIRTRGVNNDLDGADIAADAKGHLHLVVTGRSGAEPGVYHLEWDGNSWSPPHRLFATRGAPEWPRIAVGRDGDLHVVWFERPEGMVWDNVKATQVVWYSHRSAE